MFGMLFFLLSFSPYAQATWQWAKSLEGTGTVYTTCIYTTADFHILVGGYFTQSVMIGADSLTSNGGKDAFLAKLDSAGNWQWAMQFGGSGDESITQITTDSEGLIYLAGYFNQPFVLGETDLNNTGSYDVFFARLLTDGTCLNAISLDTPAPDYYGSIATAPDGSVYIAGSYEGSITIGPYTLTSPTYNLYVAKFDETLSTPAWAIQANNQGNSISVQKIGVDNQNNLYLIGDFTYSCTFNGTNPVSITSLHMDGYVAKLDSDGNCLWADKAGTGSVALADGYIDYNGDCFLSTTYVAFPMKANNSSRLEADPVIGKINNNGSWQWYEQINDLAYCVYDKITTDAGQNCYLTGLIWGTQTFGDDTIVGGYAEGEYNSNLFIAKSDADGEWQWAIQTYNGGFDWEGAPFVTDIAALEPGNCAITGNYDVRGVDFGNLQILPTTNQSSFVAKAGTEPTVTHDLTAVAPISVKTYPNPFREKLQIEFDLNKAQKVMVSIYNIKGQLVKRLNPGYGNKGTNTYSWDGLSDNGKRAKSGIYLVKVETGSGRVTKPVVIK
jgi:hypothetical protein